MKYYQDDLRAAFGKTLVALGEKEPRVVVLDADLHTSTMTVLFKKRFPDRFIQCGIAEQNMFSIAAGLARQGFIPFPTTFAAFASRKAADQVYMDICCANANVKIPGVYAGMTAAECGPSHNSGEDLAVMRAMPGTRVLDCGDNYELESAMHAMLDYEGPVYFRVNKATVPKLFDEGYKFEWGKGYVLEDGIDCTILSTGIMTGIALRAGELLKQKGIRSQIVHMPSIKPLDKELVIACAKRTGRLFTLENGRIFGGFGSAVAELTAQSYPVMVERIGLGDTPFASAPLSALVRTHHLTPEDVYGRVAAALHINTRTKVGGV